MLSFAKGVHVKNNKPERLEQILVFLAHHCYDGSQRRSGRSCYAVKVWHERLTCLGIEAKQQPTPNLETHFRCVQYIINSGGLFTHGSGKTLILYYFSPKFPSNIEVYLKSRVSAVYCSTFVMYVMGPFRVHAVQRRTRWEDDERRSG
jgi:hypothetical protein